MGKRNNFSLNTKRGRANLMALAREVFDAKKQSNYKLLSLDPSDTGDLVDIPALYVGDSGNLSDFEPDMSKWFDFRNCTGAVVDGVLIYIYGSGIKEA